MCGIAGIFSYRDGAPPAQEAELLRMREYMAKRGPDGAGLWASTDRRIGLAHRRLSVIDLSEAAAQPMATPDGRLVITFNGEIYNYRALRQELLAAGSDLRTESDTEVLLHLYARHGADMVHHLRGMYAFAVWDATEQTLFMARDPFGIKPLYYADDGSTIRFASQVKALLAGGAVETAPEAAGAAGFMLWGYVPEPFTLYRGIVCLPAGAHLTCRRGRAPSISSHFDLHDELVQAQAIARPFCAEDRETLGQLLRDSVSHHMVSDVPVGVFLSAGIDSTLVTSLAVEQTSASLHTFTLGFKEYEGSSADEVPYAERTAALLGTRHETGFIRRADFEDNLAAILAAMDQPTTDGVNTWFVCREAARSGLKVALSGLGGDELFAGYPSYRDVPRLARLLSPMRMMPGAGKILRHVLAPPLSRFTSPKYAGLLEYGGSFEGAYLLRRALYMPWELREVLDPVTAHVGLERLRTETALGQLTRDLKTARSRVAALEIAWYMRNQLLRDADWAGMSHSMEIRVPFVDVALFRALAPWFASGIAPGKADAVSSARNALGRDLLARPKSGFAVPIRDWIIAASGDDKPSLNRGLRAWARRLLPQRPRPFRALALVSDAFGGHGGIAKFNRDFISALAHMPNCAEVVAVPRLIPNPVEPIPDRVTFVERAAGSKLRFARVALAEALRGPFDLVIVGHINLSTFGVLMARMKGARSALIIHGIDAWTPHASRFVRASLRRMDRVVGVSRVTFDRFASWAQVDRSRFRLLPNCVDLRKFAPGPSPSDLADSLGLAGRKVIMTLGRLANEERYKGFDEVIEALPALAREVPDIVYLICGDGPDRARLERKAQELGVRERIVFAGFVDEAHKASYYRMADAYVMPSRGEGFGIVFLEAMSCGIPVMGSRLDGSREALLDGKLGRLVDPADAEDVREGILATLRTSKAVPSGLDHYSSERFAERVSQIVGSALGPQGAD